MVTTNINDRLFLERLNMNHVEEIFDAIDQNRDHLRKWLPFVDNTLEIRDTERFVESIVHTPIDERDDIYVIRYDFEFAGLVGFKDADSINDRIEIGYWLIANMTGKGIITESVKRLINIAFKDLKMNRIQIRCGVGNEKSIAVPKRLGFQFEGIERDGEKHANGFIDMEVYSLLRKDWQS